jgi:hypothetical protein
MPHGDAELGAFVPRSTFFDQGRFWPMPAWIGRPRCGSTSCGRLTCTPQKSTSVLSGAASSPK